MNMKRTYTTILLLLASVILTGCGKAKMCNCSSIGEDYRNTYFTGNFYYSESPVIISLYANESFVTDPVSLNATMEADAYLVLDTSQYTGGHDTLGFKKADVPSEWRKKGETRHVGAAVRPLNPRGETNAFKLLCIEKLE